MLRSTSRGNAMIETIVASLALSPFLVGMALLGKQLDVKHKSYDALRYSVWERTVWSNRGSNAKSETEITLEALDRSFGHPHAGISSPEALRADGISENSFWRDGRRSLLRGSPGAAISEDAPPIETGYLWLPGLAHGDGPLAVVAQALRMDDLNLNRRAFATATIDASFRPVLAQLAAPNTDRAPLTQRASGAVLSETWSSRDEAEFGRKVDNVTADELIETLELPGRPLSMQSLGKGGPLYGEGQYGWDPDLRPRSNTLPSAYIHRENH
jgi:hypothetical protein